MERKHMMRLRKRTESVPMLGAAVMLLRGASERIRFALDGDSASKILEERLYANRIKAEFEKSKNRSPKDSVITRIHLQLGEIAIEELDGLLEKASLRLRESLRCIASKE